MAAGGASSLGRRTKAQTSPIRQTGFESTHGLRLPLVFGRVMCADGMFTAVKVSPHRPREDPPARRQIVNYSEFVFDLRWRHRSHHDSVGG